MYKIYKIKNCKIAKVIYDIKEIYPPWSQALVTIFRDINSAILATILKVYVYRSTHTHTHTYTNTVNTLTNQGTIFFFFF